MGDQLAKLRKLTGQLHKLIYEAVKSGTIAELPEEEQLFARAMQEHMHLKHIHNALEFADACATIAQFKTLRGFDLLREDAQTLRGISRRV